MRATPSFDAGDVPAGGASTGFPSLLSPGGGALRTQGGPPHDGDPDGDALGDLHLGEIIESVAGDHDERELVAALLADRLTDPTAVRFRQEVFKDLGDPQLRRGMTTAFECLRQVHRQLVQVGSLGSRAQREGWFLDSAAKYCSGVDMLCQALDSAPIASQGLSAVRDYLASYRGSPGFGALSDETVECKRTLSQVRYTVRIQGSRVEVGHYRGEPDYGAEVQGIFARFDDGSATDYRVRYREGPGMDRVGERIADLVVRLFPNEFSALGEYCARHADFYDAELRRIEREAQFYLSYGAYIAPLQAAGLPFCYPEVGESKNVRASEFFDLALATKQLRTGGAVVRNDFTLTEPERVLVVTGPNQGGKTTFARAFGQLHHLTAVGCPVPGSAAQLPLCDRLFTLFERQERPLSMRGRLEDDLVRTQRALLAATADSVIVVNELFSSTTIRDARALGEKVLTKMADVGIRAVYVTFVEELASFGTPVVSMVGIADPANPAERSYRILRGPANGVAFALALAESYGLTSERLRERIERGVSE